MLLIARKEFSDLTRAVAIKSPITPCVELKGVSFAWPNGATVLSNCDFRLDQGEKLFLQGPSGSGKSTLLGLIAGVFEASEGEAQILGQPFHSLSDAARDRSRADAMGVIFQQFNLVPYLTLVENTLLPCRFSRARGERVGASEAEKRNRATELLARLGLAEEARADRPASALSVGQQQRVAAARALIGAPSLVIADEPTSALDAETRDAFIATLLSEAEGAAVLFVSHDASLAPHFDSQTTMGAIKHGQGARTPLAGERASQPAEA